MEKEKLLKQTWKQDELKSSKRSWGGRRTKSGSTLNPKVGQREGWGDQEKGDRSGAKGKGHPKGNKKKAKRP